MQIMRREGLGAENIAVIIENPKNGEILAMANYPNFDLNNPRDMSAYYSEEQLAALKRTYTSGDGCTK